MRTYGMVLGELATVRTPVLADGGRCGRRSAASNAASTAQKTREALLRYPIDSIGSFLAS